MLRYAFETIEEDVTACLEQWGESGITDAEVVLAFQIDSRGLQTSWVLQDGELPFGPRTCFATAVYGLDWSNIVSEPVELSTRFTLVADATDGGG